MGIIRSEVRRRFEIANANRSNIDPVTMDVRVDGPLEKEEKLGRRALLAREFFDEYGPYAPPLPLNCQERLQLAAKDDFGLAIASFSFSLESNDWDIQKHPSFESYMAGLLGLPTRRLVYGAFRDPEKLCVLYGAYPLLGLCADGVWHPPVH